MKNFLKLASHEFSNWTEGVFNVTKIIALPTVALWTFFQWNVSIFPKESHEDFVRRASRRTDLQVTFRNVDFKYLEDLEKDEFGRPGSHTERVKIDSVVVKRLYITGIFDIYNEKEFPVALKFRTMVIQFGSPENMTITDLNEIQKYPTFRICWNRSVEIKLEDTLGEMINKEQIILEPHGRATPISQARLKNRHHHQ